MHGALCVAYSGQCLTSEALGGRSANRGECAQACRMPYELICDGQPVPLGDRRYLFSPQDLAGLEVLPDLVRAGVASLKIEGRLKSPEYVANITRVYRRRWTKMSAPPDAETRYNLEMAFSRGLYTGWFGGTTISGWSMPVSAKSAASFSGEVRDASGRQRFSRACKPRSSPATASFSTPDSRSRRRRAAACLTLAAPAGQGETEIRLSARTSISAASIPATKSGKPAIRNWTANCAKVLPARRRIFSGPLDLEVHGARGRSR